MTNLILGGPGNDLLTGDTNPSDPNDHILGFSGNDRLAGGCGSNILDGGPDNDTADYSFVSPNCGPPRFGVRVDLATGRATNAFGGTDVLLSIEKVIGTRFSDTLTGNGVNNDLSGGDGADVLSGGGGADGLVGGAGDDFLRGGSGKDLLIGGAGVDTASYTESAAAVTVNLATGIGLFGNAHGDTLSGIENLNGSNFADVLTGNALANTLNGFAGDDTLNGGSGSDTLNGGAGNDVLHDDAGNDTFVFKTFGGTDTADWDNSFDRLRFEGFGASFDTAAEIIATAVQAGANLRLTLDDPGSTTDTVVVLLNSTVVELDNSDFIVIA